MRLLGISLDDEEREVEKAQGYGAREVAVCSMLGILHACNGIRGPYEEARGVSARLADLMRIVRLFASCLCRAPATMVCSGGGGMLTTGGSLMQLAPTYPCHNLGRDIRRHLRRLDKDLRYQTQQGTPRHYSCQLSVVVRF